MTERTERGRFRREQMNEGLIEGRNALTEALRAGRTIDKLYVASGDIDRTLSRLVAEAKQAGAVVVRTERARLDQMSPTGAHQGVIASGSCCATACPIPITWARSSAAPNAPAPTASSSPSDGAWA